MTREAREFYRILLEKKYIESNDIIEFDFANDLITKVMQIKCITELINEGKIEEIYASPTYGQYKIK